jgi:hypothetical protein
MFTRQHTNAQEHITRKYTTDTLFQCSWVFEASGGKGEEVRGFNDMCLGCSEIHTSSEAKLGEYSTSCFIVLHDHKTREDDYDMAI